MPTYHGTHAANIAAGFYDVMRGLDGNDALKSFFIGGEVRLYGEWGDDKLEAGNQGVHGIFDGGAGDDLLAGGALNDKLYGGHDDDFVYGGGGADRIEGGSGRDRLFGGYGSDKMYGGEQSDTIYGGNGDDQIVGASGDDVLIGSDGKDTIGTGSGSDTVKLDAPILSIKPDTILDFDPANDRVAINGSSMASHAKGWLPPSEFRLGKKALDANDHVIYDFVTGKLYFDYDGNGGGYQIHIATLSNHALLTAADFQIV